MDAIKLVYDSYENDIGFVQSDEQGDHNHQIIEGIDRSKVITFYTWGKRKHDPIQCDVVFDATLFSTKISVDVKCLSGLAMGECCEGESGGWKNGIKSHANGIIQNAVTHVRSWLQ